VNRAQRTAIENHCRLALETVRPIFARELARSMVSVVLTVNSGYE
jgi:hypothetical protein